MNTTVTARHSQPLPETSEIRSFLTQLDATFHARLNIFLVAESLLLAAVSQVWGSKELGIIVLLCMVALVATFLLWQPLRILAERTAGVAGLLRDDALYQKYLTSSEAPLTQTSRLANAVPWLFLAAWPVIALIALARYMGVLKVLYAASVGA